MHGSIYLSLTYHEHTTITTTTSEHIINIKEDTTLRSQLKGTYTRDAIYLSTDVEPNFILLYLHTEMRPDMYTIIAAQVYV